MSRIDIHTHFSPAALADGYANRSEPPYLESEAGQSFVVYGTNKRFPLRPEMTNIDAKLEAMDRCGIDVSVLSVTMPGVDGLGSDSADVARAVNEELAETVDKAPDRLAWFALLPVDDPGSVSDEMRWATGLGACGVTAFSNVAGRHLDLEIDSELFATAAQLDVPIFLHPSYPLSGGTLDGYELVSSLGYLFDTSTVALRLVLDGLFDRYPDIKLILAHAGSLLPYQLGRIDHQATNRPGGMGALDVPPSDHIRKLYVDSVCLWPPALRLAVEFFGADHVLLGSDHPMWPLEGAADTLAAVGLPDDARQLVESGAAAALLGLQLQSVSAR
jgi:predicted TIM-barrel fold metal-dependent hydrolase